MDVTILLDGLPDCDFDFCEYSFNGKCCTMRSIYKDCPIWKRRKKMGCMCITCGLAESDCETNEEFQMHDCRMVLEYKKLVEKRIKEDKRQSKKVTQRIIGNLERKRKSTGGVVPQPPIDFQIDWFPDVCPTCGGTGKVKLLVQSMGGGLFRRYEPCYTCGGKGKVRL